MKRIQLPVYFSIIFIFYGNRICVAQENIFTHYFATSAYYNPAFAGDSRFAQIQTVNRIQPTAAQLAILNNSISYDQKMLNQHSGFNLNFEQKKAVFKEIQIQLNYSYTLLLSKSIAIKAGLGLSWHSINTYANTYNFPDQYDIYGLTDNLTHEPSINEKAGYPGFATGIIIYSDLWWYSAGIDNINRAEHAFAGEEIRVPIIFNFNGGFLFPLDKNKHAKRFFDRDGGLNPYSSIGPVVSFYKQGPFHVSSIGVDAFINPFFWGLGFRYNAAQNHVITNGVSSLNAMVGYRNESLSVAYSYDFITNRTPTNYKGAHEISLIFYLFTVKEDYKRHDLIPFPNQLMY
jgi:type IX secretion system PorP/SprF family membrane protein